MNPARITVEEVRRLLDYDPKTGVFLWKFRPEGPKKWNTRYAGTIAGNVVKTGYRQIQVGKLRNFSGHALAWIHYYGEIPAHEVDHKDGERDHNGIENLRLAPDGANAINKAMQRNNRSGFAGVSFDRQRGMWRVRVHRGGVMRDGGFFDSREEAAEVRAALAAKIHGEFFVAKPAERKRFFHNRDA